MTINTRHLAMAFIGALAIVAGSAPTASAGIGIGVKGGLLFANFDAVTAGGVGGLYDRRSGLQGGLFLGGNHEGLLGVMGELNYLKKAAKDGAGKDADLFAVQVPVLLRLNLGSHSKSGLSFYGIGGPALDMNLKAGLDGFNIPDQTKNLEVSVIGGGGLEFARLIIEGRYTKGLQTYSRTFSNGRDLSSSSVALQVGFRFN